MTTLQRLAVTSVGYEGRTAVELVNLVRGEGVTVLVDVRLTPLSRKPGLSKTKLAEALRAAGVEYLHLPSLGNPRDNREAYRQADARAQARFRSQMHSVAARAALDHLAALAQQESIAFLCFERDHATCHRALVIEALEERRANLAVRRL